MAKGYIYRLLDTNGDGTGSANANGDYSVTQGIHYIEAPAGQAYYLERMLVTIKDVGAPDAGSYGNSITLTNGIGVRVRDASDTLVVDLTAQKKVKTNGDWSTLCYDVQVVDFGTGDDYVAVRWTFAKSGLPIILRPGYKLEVTLDDDLTGLVEHSFNVQGVSTTNIAQALTDLGY